MKHKSYFIFLSSIQEYNTGTINIVITAKTIPPNEGIAIGTIISEPRPVEVRTGINARIVVAVVINAGRTRLCPAKIVACLISSIVLGCFSVKFCFK